MRAVLKTLLLRTFVLRTLLLEMGDVVMEILSSLGEGGGE